ncbi:hypothetical protein LY78DRAFT_421782 [Colletotrichum sublineola]|nr:hypothetical protein LY78DRAFT_421782 [Colletotrichum sublineola]
MVSWAMHDPLRTCHDSLVRCSRSGQHDLSKSRPLSAVAAARTYSRKPWTMTSLFAAHARGLLPTDVALDESRSPPAVLLVCLLESGYWCVGCLGLRSSARASPTVFSSCRHARGRHHNIRSFGYSYRRDVCPPQDSFLPPRPKPQSPHVQMNTGSGCRMLAAADAWA